MPYITSIVLWTDSKDMPRWLKKNYDVSGKYYYLDAWNRNEILDNDVRRELRINMELQPEEIVYLHYDELLRFASLYNRYAKNHSIFNSQRRELRRAARHIRRLYDWLDTVRPKHSLAWAEFYYTFETKEDKN